MRVLWSLPKAAPALLRHLAGYADLAAWDLERAGRRLAARLIAFLIVAVCLFFAVLMGCIAVLALTWDGPHRLGAIAWMGGAFLALALFALIYGSSRTRAREPVFGSVREEWRKDAVILNKILAEDEEEAG